MFNFLKKKNFEKGTKRLYEIQFVRNRNLAAKYWSTSPNRVTPFLDFISMSHKKWSKVVEPWTKGGTLDGMYTVDKNGDSFTCKLYRTAFPE